jgi:hypothetical protein
VVLKTWRSRNVLKLLQIWLNFFPNSLSVLQFYDQQEHDTSSTVALRYGSQVPTENLAFRGGRSGLWRRRDSSSQAMKFCDSGHHGYMVQPGGCCQQRRRGGTTTSGVGFGEELKGWIRFQGRLARLAEAAHENAQDTDNYQYGDL